MIAIGTIPASYVLICTKYVKAGIVVIVSITVVALATEIGAVPGGATENFLKRYIAFTIGGIISLFFALVFFPAKASTRMVSTQPIHRYSFSIIHSVGSALRVLASLLVCLFEARPGAYFHPALA